MVNTTKCGDRRCTIEEAEFELKGYRDGYTAFSDRTSSTTIDSMDSSHTRIKTEIDEANELLESAKRRGGDAWNEVKDGVLSALEKIKLSYHQFVGDKKE
jgi:hypothetical protein